MGLPLFTIPREPEAGSKSAEKIAATTRSAIRRSTSRPTRASEVRRRRILGMVDLPGREEFVESSPSLEDPSASSAPRYMYPTGDESYILETAREHERRLQSTDQRMMPAVPESRDYTTSESWEREIHRLRQARQDLRRLARRFPAPTPPYSDSGPTSMATQGNEISPSRSLTALYPPLPAREPSPLSSALSPEMLPFTRTVRPGSSPQPRRSLDMTANLNTTNQAAYESPRYLRTDGLGDRTRSLSPDGGWDILLTSMTPDPQIPSVGSSFASTAAASSSTSGPPSTNTTLTSSGGTQQPIVPCDITDEGSDSDEEEEDMYELQDFNNVRSRADRHWRTYASVVVGRQNRSGPPAVADPEHLDGMHRIISRLAERDEIPEAWWASAGLSRNLRREPTA